MKLIQRRSADHQLISSVCPRSLSCLATFTSVTMGVPKPPLDITGHCSTIHDGTLYLFSPAGFQSIQLRQNATWTILPSGTSVEGAVCVSTDAQSVVGTPALYIVGGRTNATHTGFSGLQRFSYGTGTWENISPVVPVTQNRSGHGAAYISQTNSIAMYAGSQDPSNTNPSSQAFIISTVAPFNVISFTSLPPPLTSPMLMPWNESHAITVGGSAGNKGLYLFGQQGWSELSTALSQPIQSKATQCTVVTGDDGSKVLQEYNLGVTPNQVSRYLLYNNGAPIPAGTQIGTAKSSSWRKRKRELTAANWPAYNATGAPKTPRTNYSIAQGPTGIAVISGGDETEPILLFDEKRNAWVDPSSVFGSDQTPISNSGVSSSSAVASTTSSTSPSPTQAQTQAAVSSTKSNTPKIVGITLGVVLGLAALLCIILLCLRRRGKHRSRSRQSIEHEKENRLSFVDQGTDFIPARKPGYMYTESANDSITSLQIFQGQIPGHRRQQNSDSSSAGLVSHKSPLGHMDPLDSNPIPVVGGEGPDRIDSQVTQVDLGDYGRRASYAPAERVEQGRSAGWSQYFNNNNHVTDLGAVGASVQTQTFLHDGNTSRRSSQASASIYNDSPSRLTTTSSIKPLELNLGPKFESPRESTFVGGVGRAISTGSGYDTSHYSFWTDDRASQISSIPPIGSGPAFGNAFARPTFPETSTGNVAQAVPLPSPAGLIQAHSAETLNTIHSRESAGAQDFPMPKAYMPATRVSKTEPSSPKSSSSRGPVLRKMTGNEDMSWLNINAGYNQ